MKSKKLMIVVLVLAIVTALSAGTLAIYTTQLDNAMQTEVTAKHFIFTDTNSAFNDQWAIPLAPGESQVSKIYTLSNHDENGASEVGIGIVFTPKDFDDMVAAFNGLRISLLNSDNDDSVLEYWAEEHLPKSYELPTSFIAGEAADFNYKLKVEWIDNGKDDDHTDAGNDKTNASISFTIVGTQAVSPT